MAETQLCPACGGSGLKQLHPWIRMLQGLQSADTNDGKQQLKQVLKTVDKKRLKQIFNKEPNQIVEIFTNISNKMESDIPQTDKVKILRELQKNYSALFSRVDPNVSASILDTPAGEYTFEDLCVACKGLGCDSAH